MTAELAVAVDSAILRCSIAEAELEAVLSALSAVMARLSHVAATPEERKDFDHARSLLAQHGRDPERETRERRVVASERFNVKETP